MIHHKGGNRRFTDFEELKQQTAEINKMKRVNNIYLSQIAAVNFFIQFFKE